ncbi:NAD(P)/FAD-dependent oxidoreductase [Thalassotalea maritima]|uniref:NAD(P)/FAD-dependent oxidoreductase n=1 Tax=Thalassotalea maritima TaxID=3242416 RepID=UPI003529B031
MDFIKKTALLIALLPNLLLANEDSDIIVVGAGIVGASTAYHLAKQDVKVTVLDREGPASHASRGTFAWLNASWAKQPFAYHQLNQASVAYWHELAEQLDIPIKWEGSLEWFAGQQRSEKLVAQIAEQVTWGEPAEILATPQAQQLEPKVNFPQQATVAYSGNDGALDPQLATEKLLAAATELGVQVRFPCNVTDIVRDQQKVVVNSSCGSFSAKKVVFAVGANSKIIEATTGLTIPQRSTPGIIAITKPMPPVINRIIVAPGVHIHQRVDGRVVIGEQQGAPKTEQHKQRLVNRPNSYPNEVLAQAHFQRMLTVAKGIVPALANAEMEDMYIGWRPLPLDGHPVLGFSDEQQSTYIAVMHSGVTLAPIVGKLIAQELTEGAQDVLAPYRPQRDFELIKRY